MDIEREKELHSQIESLRSQLEKEYNNNTIYLKALKNCVKFLDMGHDYGVAHNDATDALLVAKHLITEAEKRT